MPDPVTDVEPRLAVLQEIARSTKATLERLDRRLDVIEATQRSDFRWLLGVMLGGYVGLPGVMAHGFHWF